jgi:hypothetical protein
MKLPLSKDIENRYLTLEKCAEFGCLPEVLNIHDIALLMSSSYDIADYIYEEVIERAVRSGELISLTTAERIAVDNSHPMPPIPPGKNVILQGFFRYSSFVDFPGGSEQNHLFHRDAFSAWLKQCGEWPLPESCLLSRWWPPEATIPGKPTRRTRINELHDIIWDVYLALTTKHSREPTSGEVWLELERDYNKNYRIREYDKKEVIQEIKKGTISWIDCNGHENELKKNSFKTILSRIKKERKNSN